MSFNESRLSLDIRPSPRGGPSFRTVIVEVQSGAEQRNIEWSQPRRRWTIDARAWTKTGWEAFLGWFHAHAGSAHGFRMRDWADYLVTTSTGVLDAGVGDGDDDYQLKRVYTAGSLTHTRTINKPVSGGVTVYRNASPVTIGAAAGNIGIDYTTGIVTFVADATSSATAVTPGATTTVNLTSNPGTLIAGQKLYLSGFTGADAALLNGLAHTINSVTGAGPYAFILATNTSGKTITLGAGLGSKFPQAGDALTWAGEFDVPVRFGSDVMSVEVLRWSDDGTVVIEWSGIDLVEIRV